MNKFLCWFKGQEYKFQFSQTEKIYSQMENKLSKKKDELIIIYENSIIQKSDTLKTLKCDYPLFQVFIIKEIVDYECKLSQIEQQLNKLNDEKKLLEDVILSKNKQISELNGQLEQIQNQQNNFKKYEDVVQMNQENLKVLSEYPSLERVESQFSQISTDSKNFYLQNLIDQHESKIYKYRKLQSSIIENKSDIKIDDNCYFCQQKIENDKVQTNCFHNYHNDCFISILESQTLLNSSKFQCLCNKQLSTKSLNLISDQTQRQILKYRLILNQVNSIKQNYHLKLQNCENKNCYFFYYRNENQLAEKTYCPLCLH